MVKKYVIKLWVCFIMISLSVYVTGQTSLNKVSPPIEVYVVDQETIPEATGKPGTTYTASIIVIDHIKKKVYGPYLGSSFPNSKQSLEDKEKPNTLKEGLHIFNNKYGHKGGTLKGLNLVNKLEERKTEALSWSKKPTFIVYANVHTGFSDKGTYSSRGSQGCITIHPSDVDSFFKNFDFSSGTKGQSSGTVYIYRDTTKKREAFINQLKKTY